MNAEAWVGAMVSGILYYGLAFWLYLTALRHVPASYAGAFLPLIPVSASPPDSSWASDWSPASGSAPPS